MVLPFTVAEPEEIVTVPRGMDGYTNDPLGPN